MKQSDDENTITLDDGRVFEAVKESECNPCDKCDFNLQLNTSYCIDVICLGCERKDFDFVYFKEVKK